jgi:hypothetical protein
VQRLFRVFKRDHALALYRAHASTRRARCSLLRAHAK